jgi:hypothetical protein
MLNQITLVGKVKKITKKKDFCVVKLEVDCEVLPITIWSKLKDSVIAYCSKGTVIGIKGKVQVVDEKVGLVGERVSFIRQIDSEQY